MKCPYCGADKTDVIDSRQQGYVRWRRHKCRKCGERFTTQERVVIKKAERSEEDAEG